ncbi:hypothetical protein Ade02nite_63410 [Paractinoplanes deccanensis]|uniref:Uncharacterized protein n=1 Tax=Paractinoplanes deccanensis TaxID=113561 RepID=A0ABQ3YD34_9ACTN|nr:hypothetical protein Ade02nite_63410 [Actinoplanes deccanensis]
MELSAESHRRWLTILRILTTTVQTGVAFLSALLPALPAWSGRRAISAPLAMEAK